MARIIGLDQLPVTLMDEALPEQWSNVPLDREEQTRDALVALGLQENMTHRFDAPAYGPTARDLSTARINHPLTALGRRHLPDGRTDQ